MHKQRCETNSFYIHIAGDYNVARYFCSKFAFNHGICVTITKTTYVYTAGEEKGVIIGVRNYPRFPKTKDDLKCVAEKLGYSLRESMFQDSFMIEGPEETEWYSWRETRKQE